MPLISDAMLAIKVCPTAFVLFISGTAASLVGIILVGWVIFAHSQIDDILMSTGAGMVIVGFGVAWFSGSKGETALLIHDIAMSQQ